MLEGNKMPITKEGGEWAWVKQETNDNKFRKFVEGIT